MNELSKNITYIEQWNIKDRGCYNFSFQIRKIMAYFWDNVKVVDDYNDSEIVILLSCIAVPEFIKNNYNYIDLYLEKWKKVILYWCVSLKIREEIINKYWDTIILIDHETEEKFDNIYRLEVLFKNSGEATEDNSYIFEDFIKSNYHIIVWKWCEHNCSFCVVREWKKIESYSYEMILDSFKSKYNSWLRHFRITSDDIWTYWIENDLDLFHVINKILSYNKEITLELWPIYPEFILNNKDNFFKVFSTWRITEIFTAIQHREERILKLMNRDYDHNSFENLLIELKSNFTKIKIATHLIYWFPTETKNEFLSNLKNLKFFDHIQFYRFSKTYKMKDIIFKEHPLELLEERKNHIRNLFKNKKCITLEEDNTKLVVIKHNPNKKESFVEKYF